jgi:hypothetical protein
MKWLTLTVITAVGTAVTGCDRIPFLGGSDSDSTAVAAATEAQPDGVPAEAAGQPAEAGQALVQQPVQAPRTMVQSRPMVEEPWVATHTGTVAPGMSRDDVVAEWGEPVAERAVGTWTYLYFRNGCEATCGTFDVVLLDGGQVVDAIVRGPGHNYAGTSSSPAGREGVPTLPGSTSGAAG